MTDRILTACAALTVAAILAMGADNASRLAHCTASGHSQAACNLQILGR